jgi:hypothetical protein
MNDSQKNKLSTALERELDPGEEYLWVGFPAESLYMHRAYSTIKLSFIAAVALTIFTFCIQFLDANTQYMQELAKYPNISKDYWDYLPSLLGWILSLWAVPLSLISLYAIPHFKRQANEIAYGITQSRAVILRLNRTGKLRERDYRPDELVHLSRKEDENGTGDVIFQSARGASATNQASTSHGFFAVENVIEVERLLRKQFGNS